MIDLRCGDCRELLPTLPDASVDAVIADPPYPCIKRPYGMLSEAEWHDLMHVVVRECRRVLKPHGSAVFILQPNSRKVGSMRAWLWEFMAWCCKEWNMVQDHYWWNITAPPTRHTNRRFGLMRPSVKLSVWLGEPDCYRNQDEVLWTESDGNIAKRKASHALRYSTNGGSWRYGRACSLAQDRGGTTPFNLLPVANSNSSSAAASVGHGAGTPELLCDWWLRYLTRPGDTILDPFCGSGTTLLAAFKRDRHAIGFDKQAEYIEMSRRRLAAAQSATPLLTGCR